MRVTREMMSGEFRAVLDACVLANFGVCDLLLRLAEPPRLYLGVARERGRTLEQHLTHLSKSVPVFAAHVAEHLGRGRQDAEA